MRSCQTCRWWHPIDAADGDRGQCRAALPTSMQPGSVCGEWVQTEATDWCAHHLPRSPDLARETPHGLADAA